jgi:hypothetical protein
MHLVAFKFHQPPSGNVTNHGWTIDLKVLNRDNLTSPSLKSL